MNYSFGPVTVGTTQSYTSGSVNASGVNIGANEVAIYGIAFNVNDNYLCLTTTMRTNS